MPVFGLTGNLASGKSTVLKLLKKKGARIFDADKLVHEYYKNRKSSIYKNLASVFPGALKGKLIDRKLLGEIVFLDRKKLKILEAIVHKKVIEALKAWAKKAKASKKIYIAEVQLLFEKNLENLFDATILIYTPKNILLKRIENNLGIKKQRALARLALYGPVKEKIKRADFIINNNSNIKALENKINALWDKLTQPFLNVKTEKGWGKKEGLG
jgi:dephospho-CoA kinase